MIKTIKFKILILTLGTLFLLAAILTFLETINYAKEKEIKLEGKDYTISNIVQSINENIAALENHAKDLALMGEMFFKTGKNNEIADHVIEKILKIYPTSLGGGIWFEPYVVSPEKKYLCKYAYRNEKGEISFDTSYEKESFNYHEQNWYKEIISQIREGKTVAWSLPYYENIGSTTIMTTVGVGIYQDDKLIGISTADWGIDEIITTIMELKPTENSFTLFGDSVNDFVIATTDETIKEITYVGSSLRDISWYADAEKAEERRNFTYNNIRYTSYTKKLRNHMFVVVNIPTYELYEDIFSHLLVMLLCFIGTSFCISLLIFLFLRNSINKPIQKLTDIATEIGKGNLDSQIKIEQPKEFADLANTFNKMTKDIKDYIFNLNKVTKETEIIESELSIAKKIQLSVLPKNFEIKEKEIDIYAIMETAKEVGGDFYDFFFIDDSHFMFLVADVSGKGIPAALFMMTTKTLIKNIAKDQFIDADKMTKKINDRICRDNHQNFFVTMFAGIIDLEKGILTAINCGHNPPLIKRTNEDRFEYLKIKPNLVLGAMSGLDFASEEIPINVNDTLVLYTDGVTEALDIDNKLYGEERLEITLNKNTNQNVNDLVATVRNDVTEHIGTQLQSDDITIMAVKINKLTKK